MDKKEVIKQIEQKFDEISALADANKVPVLLVVLDGNEHTTNVSGSYEDKALMLFGSMMASDELLSAGVKAVTAALNAKNVRVKTKQDS